MAPSELTQISPKRRRLCPSVGETSKKIAKKIETIKFRIPDVKGRNDMFMKHVHDKGIRSPVTEAHGYKWQIAVSRLTGGLDGGYDLIRCHLSLMLKKCTAAVTVRCREGKETYDEVQFDSQNRPGDGVRSLCVDFNIDGYYGRCASGKCLEDDGSILLEIDLQIAEEDRRMWYPPKPKTQRTLVDMYTDDSSDAFDVVFAVGNATYRAHRTVLALRCSKLLEITEDSSDSTTTAPIVITFTREDIFKRLLDHIYTAPVKKIGTEEIAVELLAAADRFDCTQLKLYIESVLVDRFLKAENAASLLVFADSHSCALLKEAATNLYLRDADSVKKGRDWQKVHESNKLRNELLDADANATYSATSMWKNPNTNIELPHLDVTTLRENLQRARLPVDGSREVLVSRWKILHSKEQNKASSPSK